MILPNLSGIESASGEDESGLEPSSGEDESGDDESGIESGSGVGMFCFFDKSYFLRLGQSCFPELDLAVIYTLKKQLIFGKTFHLL